MRTFFRRRLKKHSDEKLTQAYVRFERLLVIVISVLVIFITLAIFMLFKGKFVLFAIFSATSLLWGVAWTCYQTALNQLIFDRQANQLDWMYKNLK